MTHEHQSLIPIFAALADPTRFAVVSKLLQDGEAQAGELHGIADISAPAISRHLKVLRTNGVIQQRVDKQRRMYSVNTSAVQAIHAWAGDHRAFWEAGLGRLDAALSQRDDDG